jgi:hypothetical protein
VLVGKIKKPLKRLAKKVLFPKPKPSSAYRPRHQWAIGLYTGESPFALSPWGEVTNPILTGENVTDVAAAFVADPFMLQVDQTWYMFFEVLNQQRGKGEIGLATSDDGLKWNYQQIVLTEPFHLSYPYVFEWLNNYYLIPECYQTNSIRLYQALEFPTRWSCVGALLEGQVFLDASIFRYGDKWWLFAETNPAHKYDTLRLYYADDLAGPWLEHPASPLVSGNGHIARPAGRALVVNDRIVRYAQDCDPIYGTQVRAFEVTELDSSHYQEREVYPQPILSGSGSGWNRDGMHHIDPHLMDGRGWLACVDGWFDANLQNLSVTA